MNLWHLGLIEEVLRVSHDHSLFQFRTDTAMVKKRQLSVREMKLQYDFDGDEYGNLTQTDKPHVADFHPWSSLREGTAQPFHPCDPVE